MTVPVFVVSGLVRQAASVIGPSQLKGGQLRSLPRQGELPLPGISGVWSKAVAQDSLDLAKQAARIALERLAIPSGALKMRFHRAEDRAGQIQRRDGYWYVDLNPDLRTDPDRLVATVAHELAHIAVHRAKLPPMPTLEDERLTDAVAVLAGFGYFMLRSYHRENTVRRGTSATTIISTVGYLDTATIHNLVRASLWISTERPLQLHTPVVCGATRRVPCFTCGSTLRQGAAHGWAVLACEVCGLSQERLFTNRHSSVAWLWGRLRDSTRGR